MNGFSFEGWSTDLKHSQRRTHDAQRAAALVDDLVDLVPVNGVESQFG